MKTNEMKTVYIIAGDSAYDELFQSLGFEITRDIGQASLVVFTGGEDVWIVWTRTAPYNLQQCIP